MNGPDLVPSRRLVGVLAFAGLSSTFMFTLVIPIQARLPELTGASRDDTAWIVTITVLASAVAMPISGRLGDMYGKRRMVLVLIAVMTVGSVLAATVDSLAWIIVGRGMQGVMAGVIPLGMAIMRDTLPRRRLPGAIALMSATLGIGGSLGLPISALITEHLHWRVLFWMSAVLGIVVFFLIARWVPESVSRLGGRFDLLGALGLAAWVSLLLLAVTRAPVWGWNSPETLGAAAVGVAIGVVWVYGQLRVPVPLLNLRLAVRPSVILTNCTSLTVGFALFASNVLYPQILTLPQSSGAGFGLSLMMSSIFVMPSGLVILLLSPFSGRLAARIGPKRLLEAGCVVILCAYTFSLFCHAHVWEIVLANILIGVGIAFSFASVPLLIMGAVPQPETGALNGLNALCRSIGTTCASAAVGAILAQMTLPDPPYYPSASAFEVAFIVAASAAAVALIIALFIPSMSIGQWRESADADAS